MPLISLECGADLHLSQTIAPTVTFVNLTRRIAYNYEIDCDVYVTFFNNQKSEFTILLRRYPNVCENQCYYVYCQYSDLFYAHNL
jgi:hypothetical protein